MQNVHFSVVVFCRGFHGLEDLYLGVGDRFREVIGVHLLHISAPLGNIELVHVVLLALVQIDRLLVKSGERARVVHFSDNARLSGSFNNDKVI